MARQQKIWQRHLKRITKQLDVLRLPKPPVTRSRKVALVTNVLGTIEDSTNNLQQRIDELEAINFDQEQSHDAVTQEKSRLELSNDNLKAGLRSSKRETISHKWNLQRTKETSIQRLEKLRQSRIANLALQEDLIRVLKAKQAQDEVFQRYRSMMETDRKELRKEWDGRGGGKWPYWVTQVICELLVNGTPPSAVPLNLKTLYETLYGCDPVHTPSVSYVRYCRVLIQVIGDTITALKLGAADNWKQIFFDATTRRQVPFQAVIVALMTDGKLDPVIVSSCIFMEDETAEKTVESIEDKVSSSC